MQKLLDQQRIAISRFGHRYFGRTHGSPQYSRRLDFSCTAVRSDGEAKRPFSRKVGNFPRQLKVLSGQVEVIFGHPFEPLRQLAIAGDQGSIACTEAPSSPVFEPNEGMRLGRSLIGA